jgi:DNA-binding FrmR family transcriptional regulator
MASTTRSRGKYTAVARSDEDDEDYSKVVQQQIAGSSASASVHCALLQYYEEQDDEHKVEVPWQSVALAVLLLALGILFFIFAWLHLTQKILGRERAVSCVLANIRCLVHGWCNA